MATPKAPKIELLPLDLINPPSKDMRTVMTRETLEELAGSIARFGVLEPILVRPAGGRYEIKAGHRRFLASQMAGKVDIPAIILDGTQADDDAITLEENVLREDVNPVDIARYLQTIIRDRGYTTVMAAEKMGKSREWVNYHLRLLDLPENVKAAVEGGVLSVAGALDLSKITDDNYRDFLLDNACRSGASARVIRNWVSSWQMDEELRQRVRSGEYVIPPQIPPQPMTAECWLCGERFPANESITAILEPECWDYMVAVRKMYRRDRIQEEEEARHGRDQGQGEGVPGGTQGSAPARGDGTKTG
jgi:ParB family chromosome partitioning protein